MSWKHLLSIMNAEAGAEVAARIEMRIRAELGGRRISIAVPDLIPPPATIAKNMQCTVRTQRLRTERMMRNITERQNAGPRFHGRMLR